MAGWSSEALSFDKLGLPAIVAAAVVFVLISEYYRYAKGKLHLPGPMPYPIFGNLPQLGKDAALTMHKWSKKYGDVFKVTLGEREIMIINSAKATKELLSDQGGVYISRPMFHNYHSTLSTSAGFTIGTSPWDESCKRKRKAAATALNKTYVQEYLPIIDREALALVEDLYVNGKGGALEIDPAAYCSRYALNTSLSVNYGCRLDSVGDDLLAEIIDIETGVSDIRSTTSSWSDYVPLLRKLPTIRKTSGGYTTQEIKERRDKYMGLLLDDLKEKIAKGTDAPCITGNILKDPDAKLTPLELSSICLSMVSAGLDTLGNTFIWSLGFMAKHPEIWEKAYTELNKISNGNPPDSTEETCEYIVALYREAARYFSVLKLSLPRATLGDSEYKGVHVPSGTTVFLNAWAVHHDEDRYGDVENFRPERHLEQKDKEGALAHYSFGAGRRMCAGVHLANREMYVGFAKLIYFFKLEVGSEDYDINPETACKNTYGLSSTPFPYKVRFVPRDPEAIEQWIQDEKSRNDISIASAIKSKVNA
ncbi:hypothetical protein A1Q1_06336 [Trichosporon asahii var. asahii CBS 2479]|uniref:Uncharacterized protein n=1 Tax=Trichosporon asahii var. asahii (strain ATCC 90039 / CBS 2479 / JCM 2466 / KCTC 7840 / NBRC 103889/ NCYC 2677 / UAMH 7654) TaxID=1186058 RepID=J4UK52_TRIAS|nr:hypothetical protein A1Q1_06336 [Trichosporon asahii var. asahii CBS 2479]EJT52230.1 hypothetical protein A1Q1_06336 [Trichosporon asahii var. asahii CBS 2479]